LNGHLTASCVRNTCTKNYQNPIIDFQVTVKNVGDTYLRHSVLLLLLLLLVGIIIMWLIKQLVLGSCDFCVQTTAWNEYANLCDRLSREYSIFRFRLRVLHRL